MKTSMLSKIIIVACAAFLFMSSAKAQDPWGNIPVNDPRNDVKWVAEQFINAFLIDFDTDKMARMTDHAYQEIYLRHMDRPDAEEEVRELREKIQGMEFYFKYNSARSLYGERKATIVYNVQSKTDPDYFEVFDVDYFRALNGEWVMSVMVFDTDYDFIY